jgi:hypothetical protein
MKSDRKRGKTGLSSRAADPSVGRVIDGRNRLCKILPDPPFPKEGV